MCSLEKSERATLTQEEIESNCLAVVSFLGIGESVTWGNMRCSQPACLGDVGEKPPPPHFGTQHFPAKLGFGTAMDALANFFISQEQLPGS